MLFEEMLQEMKMKLDAHWAENEGFWHQQPIKTENHSKKDIE